MRAKRREMREIRESGWGESSLQSMHTTYNRCVQRERESERERDIKRERACNIIGACRERESKRERGRDGRREGGRATETRDSARDRES